VAGDKSVEKDHTEIISHLALAKIKPHCTRLLTLSIKDTTIFAKHGKVGTRGFKATRGAANICRSTNCKEALSVQWEPCIFFKRIKSTNNTSFLKKDSASWLFLPEL
jgi:hypothetical protein